MFSVSKRWEMVLLLLSGVIIVYTLRVNMSVAAQDMRNELNWTENQKGLVLSSFYWGYAAGQLPASRLTQVYGAKWIFGLSVLIPSVLTILVPMACRFSFSAALVVRMCIGFFESASFPCLYHFFPVWLPNAEKTFLIPVLGSGMYIGTILGFALSGFMTKTEWSVAGTDMGGWPSVFYIFGTVGVLWFPLFAFLAHESPDVHPTITADEVEWIQRGKTKTPQYISYDSVAHESASSASAGYDNPIGGNLSTSLLPNTRVGVEEPATSSPLFIVPTNSRPLFHSLPSDCDYKAKTAPPVASGTTAAVAVSGPGEDVLDDAEARATVYPHTHGQAHKYVYHNVSCLHDDKSQEITHIATAEDCMKSGEGKEEGAADDACIDKWDHARRTPWRNFILHPAGATLILNNCCFGWIGFLLLSEMPAYLEDVLGFSLEMAGLLCVFPYVAMFCSVVGFGKLFEWLQLHRGMETRMVRQSAEFISLGGCACGLIAVASVDNRWAAYFFFILSQLAMGAIQSGLACAFSDAAPAYSSSLNTLGNTCGAVAGLCGPIIVSFLTTMFPDEHGIWGWRIAFLFTAVLSAASLVTWYWYQSSEVVPALNNPLPRKK